VANIFYIAKIADAFGVPLTEIDNFVDSPQAGGAALNYGLNVGNVGVLSLTVPASFNADLFKLDGRIGVWRSINGQEPKLDGQAIFLIRKWKYTQYTTTITAYHANTLLKRRVIAYYTGTAYSKKAAAAGGNQIKAFVRENMGSSINAFDRLGVDTQADISAYVGIQTNIGDGANIAAQDAYVNLFDLVKDITNASTEAGTYLTAEIVAPTESTLELRTFATARGVDHRASSVEPVILSEATGSLANCVLDIDRSQEITAVIAAGGGWETMRLGATALDTARMGESPFNRIEQFGDLPQIPDGLVLQDKADAMLRAGRPRIEFTADVVENDGAIRGIDYDLGDLVTAEFRGQQYDCRLDVIGVAVGSGKQSSKAHVRYIE
jgi:hypothetical protein